MTSRPSKRVRIASNISLASSRARCAAQAEVRAAGAERDVVVGVAGDVDVVGLVEGALVAVGRRVDDQHVVTLRDRLAADLGVLGGGAGERHHRRRVAQELLDGGGQQRRVVAEHARAGRAAASSASVPVVMRLRVVSEPAFCSSMKNADELHRR